MDKTRRSKRSSLAVVALLLTASCGGEIVTSTATEAKPPSRHPDGVVLEPPPAMPITAAKGEARGVLALRESLSDERIRAIVEDMVHAFEREDISALHEIVTQDAVYYEAGRRLPRAMLIAVWERRMSQLDYGRVTGMEIVRPERVQRFDYDEAASSRDGVQRPQEMRPGDVLVRVPFEVSRIGSDRFFPDSWLLLLRPEGGRYRVVMVGETESG